MTVAFDHLMHWVPDIHDAIRQYNEAGLPAYQPGETESGGAGYVEIISVRDHSSAFLATAHADAGGPLIPAAEEALAGGGGALGFGITVEDVAATAARWRSIGAEVKEFTVRPEGAPVWWQVATIVEGPAWAPFAISYTPPREELFAMMAERGTPVCGLRPFSMTVETLTPYSAADWLGRLLDLPVDGVESPWVALPGCAVHFVEGDAERITTVSLDGLGEEKASEADVFGLRYQPVAD